MIADLFYMYVILAGCVMAAPLVTKPWSNISKGDIILVMLGWLIVPATIYYILRYRRVWRPAVKTISLNKIPGQGGAGGGDKK